ncbi:DUF983 domain-containing protein [Fulvimarina sp. 2208YS6-2-32]|uniref:DUF983 domain-containing protein n=1 Tax=Fulvimarina uroteuthidis TaxID=3098149 RepID=A0ABU5I336_9HYPH|nr:DUF983 domain-containing protein [Fulvimarina sp. 2208YS6-2-32]MDY8109769.1 DUF983 domain-containing protein [Fulvimarina sp. 2208YS6-2-32]
MSDISHYSASRSAVRSANDLEAERNLGSALLRGLACKCPNCGEGKLFKGFVKSVDACEACGQEIHHHRADDLPPYITIFIVGHIVVALFMGAEAAVELSLWAHLAIWVPVTILLSLVLMQPFKGATIGLQWALRMGGFGGASEDPV